jgi:hypothetical protein
MIHGRTCRRVRWTGFGQSLPSEQFPCHTPIADLFTELTEAALQTVCG